MKRSIPRSEMTQMWSISLRKVHGRAKEENAVTKRQNLPEKKVLCERDAQGVKSHARTQALGEGVGARTVLTSGTTPN